MTFDPTLINDLRTALLDAEDLEAQDRHSGPAFERAHKLLDQIAKAQCAPTEEVAAE